MVNIGVFDLIGINYRKIAERLEQKKSDMIYVNKIKHRKRGEHLQAAY